MAGCAHGSYKISKKYLDLRPILLDTINQQETENVLDKLLYIYEEAAKQHPLTGKQILKKQWKAGNFTGYIIYSIHKYPTEWNRLKQKWVEFLVQIRKIKNPDLKETIHHNLSSARSWSNSRWENGYLNVFEGIHHRVIPQSNDEVSESDPDDD
jgi:hypothetical protein